MMKRVFLISAMTLLSLAPDYASAGTLQDCGALVHGNVPEVIGNTTIRGCPTSFSVTTSFAANNNNTNILSQIFSLSEALTVTGADGFTNCKYSTQNQYGQPASVDCKVK